MWRARMKFFIDTANPGEIRKAYEMGVIDGVTTNPTLISKENREFSTSDQRDLRNHPRTPHQSGGLQSEV